MGERHFGESGARLSYGSYLHLPELLDAQVLQSDLPAHDQLQGCALGRPARAELPVEVPQPRTAGTTAAAQA